MTKTVLIKILVSVVTVVGIVLILHVNLLFPWQWTARKNRLAVLEYVDSTYSDTKFIRAYYNSTKIAGAGHDQFVFERNGIRFSVYADHGRVATDFFWYAFAEHQLYNAYIKPFTAPRNITAEFSYSASDLRNFFENNPDEDISQFDGSIGLTIYDNKCNDPRSLGWLYNFYCYCKESFPFSSYTVTMICLESSLTFSNISQFANEDEFYNNFK